MRFLAHICFYLIAFLFAAFVAAPGIAVAQSEAIIVNGEPITSYDVAQRKLCENLTKNFGERMKALLSGDAVKEKFRQRMIAAHPRSQAEAKEAAERIKKELIEEAKKQVLTEGGTTRRAVIEALIDDKLKLQAAKRLGIEITDEEVEGKLVERAARANASPEGAKLDRNAVYAKFEAAGINRKTVQEVIRAPLAWLAVIRRTCRLGPVEKIYAEDVMFPCFNLEQLRRDAVIEYREW
jgi:peptidyl-prolyl cis-trans isomerase SurA